MDSGISVECINEMMEKLKTLPGVNNRVFYIYSEDEIEAKTKGLSFPCIAVIYDGIRSTDGGGASEKVGVSASLTLSILYLFRQNTLAMEDPKSEALKMLDAARPLIRGRSSSGHKWRFLVESPLSGGKAGVQVYLQRWSTPVQMV